MGEKASSQAGEDKVYFHPEQVKYLEKMFPERLFPPTASLEEINQYMGTRRVVQFLRDRQKTTA